MSTDCSALAAALPTLGLTSLCCKDFIQCTTNNAIVSIDLTCTAPLVGDLTKLPLLSGLTKLSFTNCGLTGALPDTLKGMTGLQSLNLAGNKFTGSAAAIASLTNVKYLNLKSNNFDSIPDLSALTGLYYLNLGDRPIDTPFPNWISSLSGLQYFYMSGARLSGAIPDTLGKMPSLQYVDLSQNQLTGAIPQTLSSATGMRFLDLHGNQITGAIPDFIGNFASLETLDISNNKMSGPLPTNLFSYANMTHLAIASNDFSGTVPTNYSAMTKLTYLDVSGNAKLVGPVEKGPNSLSTCMMSSTGLCTNGAAPGICGLAPCGSGNTNGGNGNGNGNGNSNTSGNSTGANSTSSGPSMGAIIGGVIGGVALIAVVAILIWYRQRPSAKPTANPAMLPTTAGPATYTGPAAYSGPGAYPPSPPSEYAVSTGSAPGSHPPAQLVPAPIGMQPQIAYAAQNSMVSSTGPASPQPSQTGTGFFSFISGASAPYKTGADNRQSMLSTGTVPAGSTVGSAAAAAPRLVSESPAPSVGAPSTGAPSIAGTDRAVLVDRPPIQSGVDVLRPTRAILVEKPEIKS